MKYPKRMARPRQWKKKFNNIHTELRAAYNNYQKRSNIKKNNRAWGKQVSKYKKPLHFQLGWGRYKLKKTYSVNGYGKRQKTYGGHKVWRKQPHGKFWYNK